ncbi:GyrI-like domain-containing protein [Brachybacterium phenoliresistens]|uniref:GyrI-like domain-containing protein n=1 Tax=Brachybacterium phenoliresistens TaxID=396014 RepID=UPI0031D81949
MTSMPAPYDSADPLPSCRIAQAPAVPTAVVRQEGFAMYDMPSLMDGTFSHLPQALAEAGIAPIGPAFSLHHRAPVDTADLEVGFPVDSPPSAPITLPSGFVVEASELPAGRVAMTSHIGGYGGLGEAWGRFTRSVGDRGEQMVHPFWELYVTAPTPDTDPATLRTDLVSLLEPRG